MMNDTIQSDSLSISLFFLFFLSLSCFDCREKKEKKERGRGGYCLSPAVCWLYIMGLGRRLLLLTGSNIDRERELRADRPYVGPPTVSSKVASKDPCWVPPQKIFITKKKERKKVEEGCERGPKLATAFSPLRNKKETWWREWFRGEKKMEEGCIHEKDKLISSLLYCVQFLWCCRCCPQQSIGNKRRSSNSIQENTQEKNESWNSRVQDGWCQLYSSNSSRTNHQVVLPFFFFFFLKYHPGSPIPMMMEELMLI